MKADELRTAITERNKQIVLETGFLGFSNRDCWVAMLKSVTASSSSYDLLPCPLYSPKFLARGKKPLLENYIFNQKKL